MIKVARRVPVQIVRAVRDTGELLAKSLVQTRRVRSIRYREVKSFSDLLAASAPAILWLHSPQTIPPNSDLLFADLANDEIRRDHRSSTPARPGVGLARLNGAVVSGASLVGTHTTLFRLGPVAPHYVDQEFTANRHGKGPIGRRKLIRRAKRVVAGTGVLVTHWNSDVYGHWLLECMPKLLLLRSIASNLPAFRIVLPRAISPWIPSWINHILPMAEIESFDRAREYLVCERLLMPTLLMNPEPYFHPCLLSLIDELVGPGKPSALRKIYVSRIVQSHFRELSNRVEIEGIAVAEGLTVVKPESMSISDQIALFANAELVVGEFGSAMHNTLFSPPGTKVLCLNWINGLQSRIAQLRQHKVGYILPTSGEPVRFMRDAPRATYRIDPELFRRCIRALIAE